MGIVRDAPYEPMVGDPDDHRPDTTWRLAVDPGTGTGTGAGSSSAGLAVLLERCAVGDRIPLHRHDVDEVVTILDGDAAYHLHGEDLQVSSGDIVFIPAGVVHGMANAGDRAVHVHAVFPARKVRMELLERNPAPGTEAEPPMTTVYDFATGDFEVIGPTETA